MRIEAAQGVRVEELQEKRLRLVQGIRQVEGGGRI